MLRKVRDSLKSKEKEKTNVLITNQFTGNEPQELEVKDKKIERLCVPSFKEVIAE